MPQTDGYFFRHLRCYAPQTGLNEHGLAFVTLATATPTDGKAFAGRLPITSRTRYLKDILHTCKTVDDVKTYIDRYDHSVLSNDVLLYVDRMGRYLVAEPYAVSVGDAPHLTQASTLVCFCRSGCLGHERGRPRQCWEPKRSTALTAA